MEKHNTVTIECFTPGGFLDDVIDVEIAFSEYESFEIEYTQGAVWKITGCRKTEFSGIYDEVSLTGNMVLDTDYVALFVREAAEYARENDIKPQVRVFKSSSDSVEFYEDLSYLLAIMRDSSFD